MIKIVEINIGKMRESCQRTTFYVNVVSDEGYEMCVAGHRTGSIYTNFEGLTIEEARDRALIDAANWGDFLGLEPKPYVERGKTFQPSMKLNSYTNRRILAARKKESQCD